MILTATLRGSKRRRRSRKPDILGLAVQRDEEGHLHAPLLIVTRATRARSLKCRLYHAEGDTESVTVTWPALAVGAHQLVTLEVP